MAEKSEAAKWSHRDVRYEAPSQHDGKFCAGCEHFIKGDPPACTGVKQPISPRGFCFRYDARK